MVVLDFSNPFLRDYFPKWLRAHGEHLRAVREALPAWAAEARVAEGAQAAREGRAPRPLAAVFDIDEVLLCNTHLNGYRAAEPGSEAVDFHVADFFTDPATGGPWGRRDPGDPPLPGARALLEEVAALGVQPFFITGRLEAIRAITAEDFRRAGFTDAAVPAADLAAERGILVMCPDGLLTGDGPPRSIRPFKEGRRALIEKTHRIILNAGDQISDLGLHGDRQYYLPHPFYFIL
jgi:predicted secreted acid phosphatase